LADTIAGGSNDVPLTIEAGIDLKFGVTPAEFEGSIDMILKRTGIELNGKLNFNGKKMITAAQIKAQWVTPWFVSAKMDLDLYGLGIILGSFRLMIGQNLELNRTDFEGFISAKVCIPEKVPVVGGMPLAQVSFGVNKDKIWGSASIGIGFISVSVVITYYWGGSVEFGTDGAGLPEAYSYLLVEAPEEEPVLMAIGSGMRTEATSFVNDKTIHEIQYCAIDDGLSMIDNGKNDIGIGGIEVADKGKTHTIPVGTIDEDRDAIIEIEYLGDKKTDEELNDMLSVTDKDGNALKLPDGTDYKVQIGDMKNLKDGDTGFSQELATTDGVNRHLVYLMVPRKVFKDNTQIVVKSTETIETKLMSTPISPSVESVEITGYDANATPDDTTFDVTVKLDHATENDIVNLYLTKEAKPAQSEPQLLLDENGEPILDANGEECYIEPTSDPGVMIFKGLPVGQIDADKKATVTQTIDLTAIKHNEIGDIRTVIESGEYYVRAELQSETSYTSNVSATTVVMHDPLAPTSSVSNVTLEIAGNGYFNLSFDKVADAKCYRFDFLDEDSNVYQYYNGLIFEADDLDQYLNEAGTRYENLRLGGWTINGVPQMAEEGEPQNEDGYLIDENGDVVYEDKPAGLETEKYYTINVYAANQDANDAYHYAIAASNGTKTLLPKPVLPKITAITVSEEALS